MLSNMKGSGRRQILNQKRELQLTSVTIDTPGPGAYQNRVISDIITNQLLFRDQEQPEIEIY